MTPAGPFAILWLRHSAGKRTTMAQTPRGKQFDDCEPKISADDIEAAGSAGRVVVSLKGLPMLGENREILGLGVTFALGNGDALTLLFDPLAAMAFHQLAESANKLNWPAATLDPGTTRH